MKGFKRPPMHELPPEALVPEANRVEPPEEFTHEVVGRQPFYYDRQASVPAGHLEAGTLVRVERDHGVHTTVVDRRGVRVVTPSAGLRKLAR